MCVSRLVRRPQTLPWGDVAVRFRRNTIDLIVARWLALSGSTVISHLTLYPVMLLALRFVGVSNDEVSWAQVPGVFAFGRSLTALPITPGGVRRGRGRVRRRDQSLRAAATSPCRPEVFHAKVTAGVLVFRALTYGIQIPIGGITYIIWKANKRCRKPSAVQFPIPVVLPAPWASITVHPLGELAELEISNPDPRERQRQDLLRGESASPVRQPEPDHPAGRLRPSPVFEHVDPQGSIAVLLDTDRLAQLRSEEVPRRPWVRSADHDGLGEAHPSGVTTNRVPPLSSVTVEAMPDSAANDRAAPMARSQLG